MNSKNQSLDPERMKVDLVILGAGAATDGLGTVQLHGPYFTGSYDIDSLSRQPNSLWVNRNAERYLDETLTYT